MPPRTQDEANLKWQEDQMLNLEIDLKIEGDSVFLEIASRTHRAAFVGASPDVIAAAQDPTARDIIISILTEHGMERGRLSTHASAESGLVYGSLPIMSADLLRPLGTTSSTAA